MEVGETIFALNLINPKLDLSKCVIFVFLQVGQRNLEYPSFESIICIFKTGCPVDKCFPHAVTISKCMCGVGGSFRTRALEMLMAPRARQNELNLSSFTPTLTEYQSLRVKGSWVLFLSPFLPFERRLFLIRISAYCALFLTVFCKDEREMTDFPTAMIAISDVNQECAIAGAIS